MTKTSKPISAIAVFTGPKIKGTVHFVEDSNPNSNLVHIKINLEGLKKMHFTDFTCMNPEI